MRILVVEDEPKTGDYLKQGLTEAGFVVDLARDGLDGLHLALTEAYDLAVLDVMLPGIEGWQVLQGIRKAGKDMPVLFLTARDSVDDRVKGLELGADDYLVKRLPFRNCWRASAPCCDAVPRRKKPMCCGLRIWNST